MKAKKTTAKVSETAKVESGIGGTSFSISPERIGLLRALAAKSGRAEKTSSYSGETAGEYKVEEKPNGTSILTRFVFSRVSKGREAVSASEFGAELSAVLASPETLRSIPFPPEYRNLKKVSGLLLSAIRAERLVSFRYIGTEKGLNF